MPEYSQPPSTISAHQGPLVIGGKSMGGRVASMVADALFDAGRIAGLVCLGYPFHPPGRRNCARRISSTSRPHADLPGHARRVRRSRRGSGEQPLEAIEILWLEDGDHDLKPRKAISGFTTADHLKTVAAAVSAWNGGL